LAGKAEISAARRALEESERAAIAVAPVWAIARLEFLTEQEAAAT
jgi:hypothetical protein